MMWFGQKVKSRYGNKSGWWGDSGALIVACLWGALVLLLWLYGSAKNSGSDLRYKSMLVAGDQVLSDCDAYRLPTIIALPSSLSFESEDESDYTDIEFADNHAEYINLLKRADFKHRGNSSANSVKLATEAIRDISSFDGLISINADAIEFSLKRLHPDIFVEISGSIGDDVYPVWSKSDYSELFSGSSAWEVEVSLSIGANREPKDIFLEKSSGQKIIDRSIVRILSRPDVWRNTVSGCGSILISFAPVVLNGVVDEN